MLEDYLFTPDRREPMSSPLIPGLSKLDLDFDPTDLRFVFPSDLDMFDFAPVSDVFSQPTAHHKGPSPDEFRIEVRPSARPAVPLTPARTTIYKPFTSFESAELTVRGLRRQLGRIIARSTSEPIFCGSV
jgi:hypothetical protein